MAFRGPPKNPKGFNRIHSQSTVYNSIGLLELLLDCSVDLLGHVGACARFPFSVPSELQLSPWKHVEVNVRTNNLCFVLFRCGHKVPGTKCKELKKQTSHKCFSSINLNNYIDYMGFQLKVDTTTSSSRSQLIDTWTRIDNHRHMANTIGCHVSTETLDFSTNPLFFFSTTQQPALGARAASSQRGGSRPHAGKRLSVELHSGHRTT